MIAVPSDYDCRSLHLADETPNGVIWALADQQSTVKDLLDGNGEIVSHISYDSFGRVISNTGNIDFRYGYTGREADAETGLDYYRARYYDAAVGGFISEDPIGFSAGDTNLSRYVGNNPTNFTDPSGLESCSCSTVPEVPEIPLGQNIYSNIDIARENSNFPLNLNWFKEKVQNRGPWDYKQSGSQYESIGNFNYGLTGRAANIPSYILLRGAGAAQKIAGSSKPEFGNPWGNSPYGDDPRDQYWIQRGIEYYDNYYTCSHPNNGDWLERQTEKITAPSSWNWRF
jgi:RHS repeat-associated protein